jgi:hypothetical protein
MKQPLDSGKMLQNELVASIELDSWLAVHTFCIEIGAKLAFRTGSITSCLA